MYLPRLRARQFELFAAKKCAPTFVAGGKVTPVLEPVNPLNPLYASRLKQIGDLGLSCGLVLNPTVGNHKAPGSWQTVGDFYLANDLLDPHGLVVLSDSSADHPAMAAWIAQARKKTPFTVDIIHEPGLSVTLAGNTYTDVRWNVAEDLTVPTPYGLPLGGRPVIWANDPFPALDRNVDYLNRQESIYSTRPASYKSAGYEGIGDFLTIGRKFQVGGGPAYAVAIHLTFRQGNTIRIRHFCSVTNDTTDDPGAKFLEALDKLTAFVQAAQLPTNIALDEFADLHHRQHYPGLGKVKELSMVNHMLVMQAAV